MAMHLLAELGVEPPGRYAGVPHVLKRVGVLGDDDTVLLRRVIG